MKNNLFLVLFCLLFAIKINSQSTASQQVTKFTINSPQLFTDKQIWVYLPKNYQNSGKRYPVLYMHDGQNLFDSSTSYVGEWKIDEYLDTLTDHESIIIGIEHGNEKRINELTPYKNEKYGGGLGDEYLGFIIKTLKPYVDEHYRTLSDKTHTLIAGSSLGGLISLYALIKYPEIFSKGGLFSTALWINAEDMFQLVRESTIDPNQKFFFLVGSEEGSTTEDAAEMVSDQHKMARLLLEKGVKKENVWDKVIPGGKHNETLWSTNFPEVYQWLLSN